MALVNTVRVNVFLHLIKQRAMNTYVGTAPRIPQIKYNIFFLLSTH